MTKLPSSEFLQLRAYVENIVGDDATPADRIGEYRDLVSAVVAAALAGPIGQAFIVKGHYEAEAFLDLVACGGLGDVLP